MNEQSDTSGGGGIPNLWWRRLARAAAAIAAVVCVYLFFAAAGKGAIAGCGLESSCGAVLGSRWSRWLGLPVTLPAAGVYLGMLAALGCVGPGFGERVRRAAWAVLMVLAGVVGAAAAWFVGLQVLVIKSLCVYCLAVHGCGLVLSFLILWKASVGRVVFGLLVLLGALVFLAVPVGQLVRPGVGHVVERFGGEKAGDSARDSAGQISLLAGRVRLPAGDLPELGSAGAVQVIVVLYDYTCPHCRVMHGYVKEALRKYEGQLRVVVLPVPLEQGCNPAILETDPHHQDACEYVRLSLWVWRKKPVAFEEFDDWLMGAEGLPRLEAARKKAGELVGGGPAEGIGQDVWVSKQMELGVGLWKELEYPTLPVVLMGEALAAGRPGSAEEFFEVLENEVGLRRAAGGG